MLTFAKLQAAMTRLRFKDESALRGLGLAKLDKTFDAYPLVEDGQKIYVLLPRVMDPVKAQKMDAPTAVKAVIVLAKKGEAVSKIWPTPEAAKEALEAHQAPAKVEEPAAPAAAAPAAGGNAAPVLDFEIVEE
jgi:hypothetical protein